MNKAFNYAYYVHHMMQPVRVQRRFRMRTPEEHQAWMMDRARWWTFRYEGLDNLENYKEWISWWIDTLGTPITMGELHAVYKVLRAVVDVELNKFHNCEPEKQDAHLWLVEAFEERHGELAKLPHDDTLDGEEDIGFWYNKPVIPLDSRIKLFRSAPTKKYESKNNKRPAKYITPKEARIIEKEHQLKKNKHKNQKSRTFSRM